MVQVIPVIVITLFLLVFFIITMSLYLRLRRAAAAARQANQELAMQNYAFQRYDNLERAPPVTRADGSTDPALPTYLPRDETTQELPRLYEMIRRLEAEPDTVDNRGLLQDLRNEIGRLKGSESTIAQTEANPTAGDQLLSYNEVTALPSVPPPMYSVGQRPHGT